MSSQSRRNLATALTGAFRDWRGESEDVVAALAPGRVNLIGEHTDYNDGWVLPMAIERHVGVAFRRRDDRLLRVRSLAFDETREIGLDSRDAARAPGWSAYVAGTAWTMADSGLEVCGLDGVVDGDVPVGSGLSSSAALEMATARALCAASGLEWSPREMAEAGRLAEHRYVGVNCGPMDQLASALAEEECALLIDCRSRASETVAMPESAGVVVMDTGVRRALAGSAYNDRRRSCEQAVAALQALEPSVRALRDVDMALLTRARPMMDEVTFRRARHVVEENGRPAALARALREENLEEAGRLLDASHASLRELYEVSCAELDLVTDLARAHPACFGARMTGAGFGGCAIALVDARRVGELIATVESAYRSQVELPGQLFACRPAAGAGLMKSEAAAGEVPPSAQEE